MTAPKLPKVAKLKDVASAAEASVATISRYQNDSLALPPAAVERIEKATPRGKSGGPPLLVVGAFRKGRSTARTSDISPHWLPNGFAAWPGFAHLLNNRLTWGLTFIEPRRWPAQQSYRRRTTRLNPAAPAVVRNAMRLAPIQATNLHKRWFGIRVAPACPTIVLAGFPSFIFDVDRSTSEEVANDEA
jgi:hypothetical protein